MEIVVLSGKYGLGLDGLVRILADRVEAARRVEADKDKAEKDAEEEAEKRAVMGLRERYELELYDLKGTLVQRIAAGVVETGRRYEHEVRAEGMANGVYLARLTTADKVQTVKLILER